MSSVYRIGDLVLDAGRQELRRGGEPIHLGPLSYRLLLALIEAAPEVVSHDALAVAVWDGRVVSPETVSQRAKLLRQAIGDDAHAPRYIQLLRGRGYRLIPPVVPIPGGKAVRRPHIRAIAITASLGLAAAALVWRLSAPEPPAQTNPSIAVLPFADMSPGQDQEYFADGIAEEILNLLSSTTSLKVTARTSSFSFRNKDADVPTIAEKLNVSYLLQGSVRRSENRVRVAVQLVAGTDGAQLWSESYDGELRDVLRLQNEIATSVASALEVNLFGRGSSGWPATARVKPEAFDEYLRGRRHMQIVAGPTLAAAERHLKRSIEIDPAFVPAYSSLGLVYILQIMDVREPIEETTERLRNIVQRGLAIAPDDPGLIGISGQLARYDGNMKLAEQRLRRAFELDPSDVQTVMLYATFKLDQGYARESLRVARELLERDPLNPLLYINIIACHIDLGNAPGALAAGKRYDDASAVPSPPGSWLSGYARMILSGDIAGGIADVAKALDYETEGVTGPYAYPELYYVMGDLEKGDAALEVHRRVFGRNWAVNFSLIYRHLVTGEVGKARQMAVEAFAARRGWSAQYLDIHLAYLATDALIAGGDAGRAVALIEGMAPVYVKYRSSPYIPPEEFSPAPSPVKGVFTSHPALYFPVYIRALRAAGDVAGADNMLRHLEAILQLRRERGLFTAQWRVAEARALRGDLEGALDALEQGERERTSYLWWPVFLLHNEIFVDIRHHPRFEALIARLMDEMRRQRTELARAP